MCGKKGMKKYPEGMHELVVARLRKGESQRGLSRDMGSADMRSETG